jgi:hypothetical protein
MDEKFIEHLYNSLGGAEEFGQYDVFKQGISTDDAFRREFYNQIGAQILGDYAVFEEGVKKKDGGATSGSGDSSMSMSQAVEGVLGSKEKGPVNFTQMLTPSAHLNRRQQAEFARQGGYVMAPQRGKELAQTIYEKPVSEAEKDLDRIVDIVGSDFEQKQQSQRWIADQFVKMQGAVYSPTEATERAGEMAAEAISKGGYGNAIQFVNEAIQNNDFGSLRQIVNSYYGAEQAKIKRSALPANNNPLVAREAEVSRTTPNFTDRSDNEVHRDYATLKMQDYSNVEQTEQELSPLKQEQNRTNLVLDRLSSKLYALSNPDVQQAFENDFVGSKPLKDAISINQYTGLRYFKDNNPELYNQLSMELAKAADPELFGNAKYDKNNAEYKYLQYVLDKKGSELNAMAIDMQLQQIAPEKGKADAAFRTKLNDLAQAMNNAVTYEQRRAIQEQIQLTQSQYEQSPVNQQVQSLLSDAQQADVNFNEKYPDYSSRAREQAAKDLLQNDGLAWWQELGPRVKWLFLNTVTGLTNQLGLNELEFGRSRNYLRDIRKAEQQQFEQYQPTYQSAVQGLYKLNLNAKDFGVINDIRNSDMDREEQLKAAADYLDANRNRIGYVENPQAGKRNWTFGAIGNQVADVGTQVIYQGALTYLTAGAARAVLIPEAMAAVETGSLAAAETAAAAEGIFGPAAATSAELSGAVTGVKSRLINLGTIFGTSYATAYQPAYQQALQAGKSIEEAGEYANQIAIVNGLSETISPDIDILKKSVSGVRGLAQVVTPSTLSLAQRLGRGASAFGKGYVRNVVPETLEEVAAAYGEFGVDAMHNINQDEMNALNERVKNAVITTAIGMTPMGAFSGVSSVRNQSRMVREQFYQAGLYPDIIRSEINSMLENDQISQEEANRRISMINTMSNIIRDIPPRRNGSQMSDAAKVDYAFSRLKSAIARNELDGTTDPNAQADLQGQMNEEQTIQDGILNETITDPQETEAPATPATQPAAEAAAVPAAYEAGDVLVNNELGDFEIAAVKEDGSFDIRLPNGQVEAFTEEDIAELIRPAQVNRVNPPAGQTIHPAANEDETLLYLDDENGPAATPASQVNAEPVGEQQQPADVSVIPPAEVSSLAAPQNTPSGITVISPAAPQQNSAENQPADVTPVQAAEPVLGAPVLADAGAVGDVGAVGGMVDVTQDTAPISSPVNTNQNAVDQVQQQESIQEQRPQGSESGQAGETGSSDSLQPAAESQEERTVNENAGLTIEEQEAIDQMTPEQLYNAILDVDEDSPIRGRINQYTQAELQSIYKGTLNDYSRSLQEPAPTDTAAAPNYTTAEPVRAATRAYNQAREAVTNARQIRDRVQNRNSTEYRDREADYQRAVANQEQAENAYLEALRLQNQALREQQRNALGISPEGNARADARIIANYIEMARIYARKGVRTLADFADQLGEQVNDFMRRAWEITAGNNAPTQNEGESYRDYLKRLREWETGQIDQSRTAPERRAVRELTAELRTGARRLRDGIRLLGADINLNREQFNQRLGLPANDYLTYVAALKETIANNRDQRRTGREILNSLREAHPNEVITSEMDILRMRLAAEQRGSQAGYRQGRGEVTREMRNEVRREARERTQAALNNVRDQVDQLLNDMYNSDLLRSGNFSENDLIELARVINSISTERQINALKSLFLRLVQNSSQAQAVSDIKKLQGKLSQVIKGKDTIPANLKRKGGFIGNKTILRALRNLNPNRVSQPLRYTAILENVVNSLAGTDTLRYTNDEILDFINTQLYNQRLEDAQDLKTRYSQTLAAIEALEPNYNPDQVMSQDEFNSLVDQISNDPDLTQENRLTELANLYTTVQAYENEIENGSGIDPTTGNIEAQLGEMYQEVRQGMPRSVNQRNLDALVDVINTDQWILSHGVNFPVTDEQKSWIKALSQLDPTRLQPKQIVLMKNVIDNILTNQDFSGAQYFAVVKESQDRVNNFTQWTAQQQQDFKRDSFGANGIVGPFITEYAADISSSDQTILTIANNARDYATRLMDVTALGDVKAAHAQAAQLIDREISRPLADIRKKYKNSGLREAESTYRRGMYAYLMENNYGTPEDQQREFERRKQLVEQDIQIKERVGQEGDEKVAEEAAVLRKIYEDSFAGIDTYSSMQNAKVLNEGEQAVYDLFRNFYDSHKEDFREVMETLLNQPFHEVQNYVKDSYRILETGLTDADFRDIDQSNFYTERDPSAASTATMQRNQFSDMDNIAMRDMEGRIVSRRVINYNFDLAQLNNSRGMIEDINSLKARVMARMALNDPALRETVGAANQRRLASTIKQQVQQSLGLYSHPEQSAVESWAGRIASTLNKVGVRMILFSLGQIPKQFGDIIVNTAVNLGADIGLFFDAWGDYKWSGNEDINGLLNQSEIGTRGKTMAGTNWMTPTAINQLQALMGRMGVDAEIQEPDRLARITIEGADTYGARIAWLAYYMQSLRRQGLIRSAKDVDWGKENRDINKEARDYAQLMTATRLNVNSKESQSKFYSKFAGWGRLFQVIFLPLSSFNMNNYATMYRDINTLFRSDNREQKNTAFRSIGSRIAAELSFQIIRGGISMLVKEGVRAALEAAGVEPPERKKGEFWKKVFSESVKNMMFGMLGNWSVDAITTGINWMSDKAFDKKILDQYEANPNSPANNFGMASLTSGTLQNLFNYSRDLIGRTDPNGNPVEMTTGERAVVATAFLMNLMAMRGMMIGEAKQIADGAARQINNRISKDAKDPYWILMNNPDAKPDISINGRKVVWDDPEQLKYFQEQKAYHMNEMQNMQWDEKYKSTEATTRAKIDLQLRYGDALKTK